jgi:hypothetical protein
MYTGDKRCEKKENTEDTELEWVIIGPTAN